MRRRLLLTLVTALSLPPFLAGCASSFTGTFVVEELSILAVRVEPSELVYDLNLLRQPILTEIPLPNQLRVTALVANPESLGGQDAIERYQWSIGDPPLEGTPILVTEVPELRLEGEAMGPAMDILGGEGVLTPAQLADLLEQGPLRIPLVMTAMSGLQSSTAVKMLTVRGTSDGVTSPNENPTAEGLEMDSGTELQEWNETQLLENEGRAFKSNLHPDPGDRIAVTVNPEDDAKDGDVTSTMYTTAGNLMWSTESMRTWWLDVPEDYAFDAFEVFVVLRDLEGAQSWVRVIQPLGEEVSPPIGDGEEIP